MKHLLWILILAATGYAQTSPRPPAGGQITGVTGNGQALVTSTGNNTSGHCVSIDANGNYVDSGVACGGVGTGDVVGPSSATAGAVALFDGTTGKLLKNSNITIDTTAGRAGGYNMPQGTAATPGTTSVLMQAPAAVTSYSFLLPASVGVTGVLKASVASTTATTSIGQIVNAEITNSTIDLTTKVTGILPSANGGTANGFTKFSGPATSEKTFTLPNASSTLTITVASGAKALATSAISANTCSSAQTDTATGTTTTDVIGFTPNADITAVTGYNVAGTFGLNIFAYPTADTVNFKVCNTTTGSITPGAVTLNWRVTR